MLAKFMPAGTLIKAGELMLAFDAKGAMQMLDDACAVFEEENRGTFANDSFKKCLAIALKAERYSFVLLASLQLVCYSFSDAIALMKRQNRVYQTVLDTFSDDLYKNLLSSTVSQLHFVLFHATDKVFSLRLSTST